MSNQKVFLTFNFGEVEGKQLNITKIIELFHDTVPETARKFYSLCTNSQGLSFVNSRITRVVAPEFIIQAGAGINGCTLRNKDDESSKSATNNLNPFLLFTPSELNLKTSVLDAKGLVCVAATHTLSILETRSPDEEKPISQVPSSCEFFITLSNGLHHFKSMRNKYIVVGKVLKGLDDNIIDKLAKIKVDLQDRPITNENDGDETTRKLKDATNINQGQSFYIKKAGELRLRSNKSTFGDKLQNEQVTGSQQQDIERQQRRSRSYKERDEHRHNDRRESSGRRYHHRSHHRSHHSSSSNAKRDHCDRDSAEKRSRHDRDSKEKCERDNYSRYERDDRRHHHHRSDDEHQNRNRLSRSDNYMSRRYDEQYYDHFGGYDRKRLYENRENDTRSTLTVAPEEEEAVIKKGRLTRR